MRTLKRIILLVLAGAILFAGWFVYEINKPVRLPVVPYEFSIEPGSSLRSVAKQLADAGVLQDVWSFVLLSRVMGLASSLKAGDYEIGGSTSSLQLLERITKGDVNQSEIRFIEGWTFSQLRQILDEHPAVRHDTTHLSDKEILRLIGAGETPAEGLFFPDTYFFARGSSDTAILRRAYHAMQNHLHSAWAERAADLPLTDPYQALILASIVEKETGRESDRTMVAGVFINRLRLGMLLQTDPAVIYGLGKKFDGNLRKKDLLTDQEYNTYMRGGLPPTPIAMPGLASIQAALNPAKTKALYFVAKGNGESHFSDNLADHNRAVSKYQKRQTP
ncbi:aminodeoxychorismate lyase [Nitrosospira lacus]|uniref:Endolytic murein transglycosylase n=1 Tax=Nitrosospira lacus TaxID=1288494 RepID=A0A1W6SRT9_9PROT|nr:endolytic transglycosylase MltG [Nitrosospira lacus]ARO88540.1 aminodeoxychorismate lyase [Nitrosospira lacus]